MAFTVTQQTSPQSTLPFREVQFLAASRPWLSLYGLRVRPVPPVGSTSSQPIQESALINRILPDELLQEVFIRLTPVALGRAACTCRRWRYSSLTPALWRSICLKAWQALGPNDTLRHAHEHYGGSWRKMWANHPRLRTDGIYVSRNTHLRCGIVEWRTTNPVHLVCYYRYLRFFPSGKFFYKVSPQILREVAKELKGKARPDIGVFAGRCTLTNDKVEAAVLYPGQKSVWRLRARLRGTCPGANNRLDLLSIVTSGINEAELPPDHEDVLDALQGWEDNESHHPDVPATVHKRGMAPLVFVPFEEVDTDIINLPVDRMDFYVPG